MRVTCRHEYCGKSANSHPKLGTHSGLCCGCYAYVLARVIDEGDTSCDRCFYGRPEPEQLEGELTTTDDGQQGIDG